MVFWALALTISMFLLVSEIDLFVATMSFICTSISMPSVVFSYYHFRLDIRCEYRWVQRDLSELQVHKFNGAVGR